MSTEDNSISSLMAKARAALEIMHGKTQEEVDEMARVFAKVVNDNAEMLATMAVEETRMGNIKDKTIKCHMKSQLIWHDLKNKKTVGVIREDRENGLVEIAEPVGVVAALIPTTNPKVTAMSNAMFAIKGRNVIIMSPHPRAMNTIKKTVELMVEAGKKVGMPENAIQLITDPSVEKTNDLMREVDVVLATGGSAMVKAAYSSGKPSFGVGPGNVPVIIDEGVDVDAATADIVTGKAYDNGLICASEQAIMIRPEMSGAIKSSFEKHGAYIITDREERRKLKDLMWIDGHLNPDIIGQSAVKIAGMAGIQLPNDGIRILIVEEDKIGPDEIFSKEKMSPVLALYEYDTFPQAIDLALKIIKNGGIGHTAGIHTPNKEHAREFAMRMPASRVIVNACTATTAGGSKQNALIPTTTMGCGSWGNNSTSDNVSAEHLITIKRMAFKHDHPLDTTRVFEKA